MREMKEKTKEEIVKEIDYLIGRHYDLSNKTEALTEIEIREAKGYGVKFALFSLPNGSLSGMTKEEYLSLTDRDWGNKAQKEIAEGKRHYDNKTEEKRKEVHKKSLADEREKIRKLLEQTTLNKHTIKLIMNKLKGKN